MTRFMMEYTGAFGEFWRNEAQKSIADMQKKYDNGEILIDEDGAAKWASNGKYLPEDCAEMLTLTSASLVINCKATNEKRDSQTEEFLREYRANYTGPSAEELNEMANVFAGQKVVDIITGKTYQF